MSDDLCIFVILASLIALVLPPAGTLFYVLFAGALVWLAARADGMGQGKPAARPGGAATSAGPAEQR